MNKKEYEELVWKKLVAFLVWLGSVLGFTFSLIIGVIAYGWIDEWEGHIEYSLLPFIVSVTLTALILLPFAYLYRKYCILPFEKMEESWSPWSGD